MEKKKILIAEDDMTSATMLDVTLQKAGYDVQVAKDGVQALAMAQQQKYTALLTDWMMPNMDGIELIHRVRASVTPNPVIIVITALSTDQARMHALDSGADDYLAKPVKPQEVLHRLQAVLARAEQTAPDPDSIKPTENVSRKNHCGYIAVVIASCAGGPPILGQLLSQLKPTPLVTFFVVQHGPVWMIEMLVRRMRELLPMDVHMAEDNMEITPGGLYLAPGDHHMLLDSQGKKIKLDDGPAVNFVKPSADPMFMSAAQAFGADCVSVILTGMGRDGAQGAARVAAGGGAVIVQDPEDALATSMPSTAIGLGIVDTVAAPADLALALGTHVRPRTQKLVQIADALGAKMPSATGSEKPDDMDVIFSVKSDKWVH